MSPIYIGSWFTQLLGYRVQLHATQVRIKFEIIWSLIKNIIVDFGSWRSYLWNSYTITYWINFPVCTWRSSVMFNSSQVLQNVVCKLSDLYFKNVFLIA